MNILSRNQGSLKIWAAIIIVVILVLIGFYLLFSKINSLQEKLSAVPQIATTTEDVLPTPTVTTPAAPKPVKSAPIVATVQPAAINWIGTWNGPMKITAPQDCVSGTGRDTDITFYISSVADNKIIGRITAYGLGTDKPESVISKGSVNGDKFTFSADEMTRDFVWSGSISGDTLSVKSVSAYDCGNITTEKPVQLFRVK